MPATALAMPLQRGSVPRPALARTNIASMELHNSLFYYIFYEKAAGSRTANVLEREHPAHRCRHQHIFLVDRGQRVQRAPAGAVTGDDALQSECPEIADGVGDDWFHVGSLLAPGSSAILDSRIA